jgi:xanthine dehydrogenase molybdenum-binding subunit
MAYDLLGKNFVPPDVRGKVTGSAKYAEDFRRDGMVFCRLLVSPMPHARVAGIDASKALAMEGVLGVLTADDVPAMPAPNDPILSRRSICNSKRCRSLSIRSTACIPVDPTPVRTAMR